MFDKVLVPFDGSDASLVALDYGIAFAKSGAKLFALHVVDERALIAEMAAAESGFDPTSLIEEVNKHGRALLDFVTRRCRTVGIDVAAELVHNATVPAILETRAKLGCDLVVLGTHGRKGFVRAFLGSTTEGVLRMSHEPVLTVRAGLRTQPEQLFKRAIVALDDSGPAEAALSLAVKFAMSIGTEVVPCIAIDTHHLHDMAYQYGYDPRPFLNDLFAEAREQVKPLMSRAGLAASQELAVIEGKAADAILQLAEERNADVILIGSHGRRGLSRIVLGSVAEGVVRRSPIPVLVVRQ